MSNNVVTKPTEEKIVSLFLIINEYDEVLFSLNYEELELPCVKHNISKFISTKTSMPVTLGIPACSFTLKALLPIKNKKIMLYRAKIKKTQVNQRSVKNLFWVSFNDIDKKNGKCVTLIAGKVFKIKTLPVKIALKYIHDDGVIYLNSLHK